MITVNQGIDPANAAFIAGGGAAGVNAVAIGRRLGCHTVLVPETGAVLAAAGALVSDLMAHHQAMFHTDSRAFDLAGVNAVLQGLEARCRDFAKGTGADPAAIEIDWSTEARYPDQAWEIEVPLRKGRFGSAEDVAALVADYFQEVTSRVFLRYQDILVSGREGWIERGGDLENGAAVFQPEFDGEGPIKYAISVDLTPGAGLVRKSKPRGRLVVVAQGRRGGRPRPRRGGGGAAPRADGVDGARARRAAVGAGPRVG